MMIIISYRFFIGKNYVEYCNSDTCDTDILLHNVKWERLILDEAMNILMITLIFRTKE